MKLFEQQKWILAVAHLLGHRPSAARIAGLMIDRNRWAQHGGTMPYFTHTALAYERGVLHRNTTRAMMRELQLAGFIILHEWQPGRPCASETWKPYKFTIRWTAVGEYLKTNGLRVLASNAKAMAEVIKASGRRVRSVAAWHAERRRIREETARMAEERRQAAEAHRAAQAAERERAARAAATEAAGDRVALLRAAIATCEARGVNADIPRAALRRLMARINQAKAIQS